jgi:hypothetical protein
MILIAEIPPIVNISSSVQIASPVDNTDRNYALPISINGSTLLNVIITIYVNGSSSNISFSGGFIIIPMPNTTLDFVEVL